MDNDRLTGQLDVITNPVTDFDRVEVRGRIPDRDDRYSIIAGLRQGKLFEGDGVAPNCGHEPLIAGDPIQNVLMEGNGVLGQASVRWIRRSGAVAPDIAHHIPFVVICGTIIAGGVWQAKPVAHLVGNGSLIGITPGGFPCHVPEPALPIECSVSAPSPR